jgi:hypothetical protein
MRLTHLVIVLFFSSAVFADNCADLSLRFAGEERFKLKLAELDDLKSCINAVLREKVSASSSEARGSTSGSAVTTSAIKPRAAPVLKDAE